MAVMTPATATSTTAAFQEVARVTVSSFAEPDAAVRPKLRWWWPGAFVDTEEIVREIEEMARAGFGGFEIADVFDSVHDPIDPVKYGWGTPAWNAAVEAALRAAREHRLIVDLTIGPHWPSAVPTITPDSVGAAKELAFGSVVVRGGSTYRGPVPVPATPPSGTSAGNPNPPVTPELVAVQAWRCSSRCSGEPPVLLDRSSYVDLTPAVKDGQLSWTAPADGEWVVLAFWQRGTGEIVRMYDISPGNSPVTSPQSYVVDHFSREGVQVVTEFWEANLLSPEIRVLLSKSGGAIFEDSLELKATCHWTPDMLTEFENRRGYSLMPYLPLLVRARREARGPLLGPLLAQFDFGDDTAQRVQYDFEQTLSELWIENRIKGLKQWANSLGLQYRNQGYGITADSILAAATTDVPEGESLGFGQNLDAFRALASGRDMGGRRILSDEAGAFFNGAYNTTWKAMLTTINSNFAAGVNQVVLHGFAYATAPGARWPGFHPFSPFLGQPGFAEPWGPRQPTWTHVRMIADYLARTQLVLQSGKPEVDVAIYRQEMDIGRKPYFEDPGLSRAGYSYGFVSPGVLRLPEATVAAGRLAPDGPGYKALVLNNQASMPLDVAARILAWAQKGFPVVVVGAVPQRVPGLKDAEQQDAALKAIVAQLLSQPSVARVATAEQVPEALRTLGVRPSAEYGRPSDLLYVHRVSEGVHYYYLYNSGDTRVDVPVSFVGGGEPYELDAWTGQIRALAVYRTSPDGRTQVRVALAPGDTAIIAVTSGSGPSLGERVHATESEAHAVWFNRRGDLVLRVTRPGTYTTVLSNGSIVRTEVAHLPPAQELTRWRLSVEEWRPGSDGASTSKTFHLLDLAMLKAWTDIPELQDASGIGRYVAEVTLDPEWSQHYGAYLRLGEFSDTVRVTVNGQQVGPVDLFDPVLDVGSYLRAGRNIIEIEVATTLNNRLRAEWPDVFGRNPRQPYGLIGPVELIPYMDVPLPLAP